MNKDEHIGSLVSRNRVADILGVPPQRLRDVANKVDTLYRSYDKAYLSGTKRKTRRIDIPADELKNIQTRINRRILQSVELPDELNGGIRKRTLRRNAAPHTNQPEVIRIDLRKYFESISTAHVAEMWRMVFKTGRTTTWLLTRLTTFNGHIPQGAPTSTTIANLVFAPIAEDLRIACAPLRLSTWVDDITVSGKDARKAINLVASVVSQHRLAVSREKTKIMRQDARQTVPGAVVNQGISNGRHRLRQIKGRILSAIQTGAAQDIARALGSIIQAGLVAPSQGAQLQKFWEKRQEFARKVKAEASNEVALPADPMARAGVP